MITRRSRRVLTDEQIQYAKTLKEQGYTKRRIARILEVGETTIWDNVYRKHPYVRKRNRPSVKRPTRCALCHIPVTKDLHTDPLFYKVKTLKKHDYNSLEISKMLQADLSLVNKYFILDSKEFIPHNYEIQYHKCLKCFLKENNIAIKDLEPPSFI